jgi:hypothetical protein
MYKIPALMEDMLHPQLVPLPRIQPMLRAGFKRGGTVAGWGWWNAISVECGDCATVGRRKMQSRVFENASACCIVIDAWRHPAAYEKHRKSTWQTA